MNYVVISFGLWVLASKPKERKGWSRREYTEPHRMLYERIFTIRLKKFRRFQLRLKGSVLRNNIKPIF